MSGIAIIEEDTLMRSLMSEWLIAEGYRVRGSNDANDAPADLVLVDLYMPRCRGSERLDAARKAHPGVPIVAISAQFWAGCADSTAQALGVAHAIAKPFGRDTLMRVVRSVIGSAPGAHVHASFMHSG